MKALRCLTGLLLACGVPAYSEDIELTGLLDIGGCRMACFRTSTEAKDVSLVIGQTVEGVTLQDLDAKAGWARFRQGEKVFEVQLSSFCSAPASLPPAATRLVRPPGKTVVGRRGKRQPEDPDGTSGKVDGQVAITGSDSAEASTTAGVGSLSGTPAGTGSGIRPGSAGGGMPGQASFAEGDAGPPMDSTFAQPDPSSAEATLRNRRSSESDPVSQEGERIRTLYGLQAFLDWDLARGQAALAGH